MDDAIGPVEVAVPVEPDEVRSDRALLAGVHRERGARPVQRAPERAELVVDPRLVVLHPAPHLREELLAREAVPAPPLLRELSLDDDLADDPGVVRAREPEGGLALHPVPARHKVLVAAERKGVPEMEVAGDVRRREHHREGRPVAGARGEEARSFPPGVELGLDRRGPEVLLGVRERRRGGCADLRHGCIHSTGPRGARQASRRRRVRAA